MEFGLKWFKWVHNTMGRYELILKLDGALWPRIILKLLLTPKGAIEDPTNPKKVLKSAPNQPSFCFRVNSFRFDNSFRLDSDHVEDTDNEDVGTDNEDVGTDKDKREMQRRKMVSITVSQYQISYIWKESERRYQKWRKSTRARTGASQARICAPRMHGKFIIAFVETHLG